MRMLDSAPGDAAIPHGERAPVGISGKQMRAASTGASAGSPFADTFIHNCKGFFRSHHPQDSHSTGATQGHWVQVVSILTMIICRPASREHNRVYMAIHAP